jgi:thiol-disulfide isomerase/thioredoxin
MVDEERIFMPVQMMDIEMFKSEIFDFSKEQDFEFQKSKPVILNFFGTWCGPCHAFRPALESVAEKHAGKLNVFKVDIDTHPELPTLFGVMSVPTTVFFIPNEEPVLVTGNIGEQGLERAVSELFGIT